MTHLVRLLVLAFLSAVITPAAEEWPRVFVRNGVTNIVYQPQLESWDYISLKATSAVAVQPTGAQQPTFGTIKFLAKTRIDRSAREVVFEELQITDANFPSAADQKEAYLATLRSLLPKEVKTISLDRVEASLAILEQRQKAMGQPLLNMPPSVIFSTKPAMLVIVDGPPVYRAVEKTQLERIFNSRALILHDRSGKYYLHLFDGYMEAPSLTGPWSVAKNIPDDVKSAEKLAIKDKQVDLLAGQENPDTKQKPSLKTTPIPELHVVTVPTELILTQGEPQYAPLPPTQLLYVTNTLSHVFKLLTDQKTYVLLSGRWFRSDSFKGPWEYVSAKSLPQDFSNIPDDSAKENVKAAVPGTEQAEEAVIANTIPNTVKVDRQKARMDPRPQYDGSLQLRPIENSPLQYVVNCPVAVIQVDPTSWYASQNGVWFVAGSAEGPWTVATNVPPVIYSIPPSSPMHYVVYSRIYMYDPNYVWVGTTPGYYGAIVGADGVVVYGTGYSYPAYVGTTIYVSYPLTYGYGFYPCWTPWAGWAYGFGVGWALSSDWYWWCYCPPAPYWGPYWGICYGAYYNAYGGITAWGPYGWAGTSGYVYHQNGPWTGVSRTAAGYNAWTGNQWASQYGRAYNSTTGTRAVGHRGAVNNVYTGNYAYGGRGAAYNPNTGMAAAGGKVTWGNEGSGNSGTAGRGTIYNPNTGNATQVGGIKGDNGGVVSINGNVIAGNDGNYYRRGPDGGWEQVSRPPGTAAPAQRQSQQGATARQNGGSQAQWQQSAPSPQQRQALERQNNARQSGAQRQSSYQSNRPTYSRGGGGRGGGGRGGGGRR